MDYIATRINGWRVNYDLRLIGWLEFSLKLLTYTFVLDTFYDTHRKVAFH
jgi:hypothetical protein